jgi:hypothetical protein
MLFVRVPLDDDKIVTLSQLGWTSQAALELVRDPRLSWRSAVEVTPIRELDGQVIGSGKRGPVAERIQQAFIAATSGRDRRYASWLHLVAPRKLSFKLRSQTRPGNNQWN